MKVTWWKLEDKMELVSVDPVAAVVAWRGKKASFWADIDGYEPDELDAWLREIRLSDAARE